MMTICKGYIYIHKGSQRWLLLFYDDDNYYYLVMMMFMMMTIIIINFFIIIIIVMMMVMMFLLILLLTLPNIQVTGSATHQQLIWGMTENCFERTEGADPPKLVSNKDPKKKKNTRLPLVDLAKYGEVSNIQVSFRKKKCFRWYLKTVSFQVWLNHVKSYNLSTLFVDSPNIMDRFRLAFWPQSLKRFRVFFSW